MRQITLLKLLMISIVTALTVFAICAGVARNAPQAQNAPALQARNALRGVANPDFEQGAVGQPPPGWFVPPPVTAAGYSATLSSENPKSGRQCVLLAGGPNVKAGGNAFGNIMQALDATPYRGKRIHFHASLRLQAASPGDQARIWLRVDRAGGVMGLFDNMNDHPLMVSDKVWHDCDIVGDVEADAAQINIGLLLIGTGKAWMDNISLTIEGDAKEAKVDATPATALPLPSTATTERLAGLCRVWGAAKYFHPWTAYKDVDWDAALVAAIPKVRAAQNGGEYKAAIDGLLATLHDPVTHTQPTPDTVSESANGDKAKTAHPVGKNSAPAKPQPYIRWLDDKKTAVIVADEWAQFAGKMDKIGQFSAVMQEAGAASTVIFDLRNTSSDEETAYWFRTAFERALPLLLTADVPLATSRHRLYSGYPPQSGGTSGGYYAAWVTRQAETMRGRRSPSAAAPRMAFLVNPNSSGIADICSGLQAAKLATIVQEGESQGDGGAETYAMTLPDNVAVTLRIGEFVSPGGSIGFHPDITVPVSKDHSDANPAFVAAHKAALQPMGTAKATPAAPAGLSARPENTYPGMSYPNAEYRLLSLFRLWNVIHYFYPYKHLMDTPWDKTLTDFIPQFETNANALDYATTIARLVARLNDSHGFTRNPILEQHLGGATAPLALKEIEGKTVVAAIAEGQKANVGGIEVGDAILALNGEDIAKRRAELGRLFAASTPQALSGRIAPYLLRGNPGSKVKIRVQGRDGTVRDVELACSSPYVAPPSRTTPVFGVLPSGLGYMDLARLTPAQVDEAFIKVKDTPGLIFDMRGYPNGTAWAIAPHLTHKRVPAARFQRPEPHTPDEDVSTTLQFVQYAEGGKGDIYKGKVVVLINEDAISQAEHTCLFIESCTPTTFIGTPTMGANGDVTNVILPGNILVNFTGHDVRHADGRQLQRVGIQPDIKVAPTIAGIRQGKDEILEAAVAHLTAKP